MDFVAIDFETANEQSSSACQLGAVVVSRGQVVDSHCWLIRPRPLRFSSHCIAVHGIHPSQVADQPEFGELWSEIRETLSGAVLVAHNAGFDMNVLRSCLQLYNFPVPDMQFTCTRSIARQAWPNHSGFGLRAIADRLGIQFRHHDALEDARACAKILLAAAERWGEPTLEKLEKRLCLSRGRAGEWGCGGPRRTDVRRSTGSWTRTSYSRGYRPRSLNGEDHAKGTVYQQRLKLGGDAAVASPASREQLEQWRQNAKQRAAFNDQKVVITGLLTKMEREDAEQMVTAAGGQVCTTVSRRTNFLVIGKPDQRTLRAGRTVSTKEEKAKQLQAEGCKIQVLKEDAFLLKLFGLSQPVGLEEQ